MTRYTDALKGVFARSCLHGQPLELAARLHWITLTLAGRWTRLPQQSVGNSKKVQCGQKGSSSKCGFVGSRATVDFANIHLIYQQSEFEV